MNEVKKGQLSRKTDNTIPNGSITIRQTWFNINVHQQCIIQTNILFRGERDAVTRKSRRESRKKRFLQFLQQNRNRESGGLVDRGYFLLAIKTNERNFHAASTGPLWAQCKIQFNGFFKQKSLRPQSISLRPPDPFEPGWNLHSRWVIIWENFNEIIVRNNI